MPPTIPTQSITFENNHAAMAVFPPTNAKATEILDALNIEGQKAVLLIIGGADNLDDALKPKLTQLFGRGIARAAANVNAVVIDGGTKAGVMELMGQGVADRCFKSPLIGVAPAGLVTYPGSAGPGNTPLDPNHSHFVLVPGDVWGSETSTIFQMVCELRNKVPAVALLAGGGDVTRNEALQVVRQNLPLIVIDGSGGFADQLAAGWKARKTLPNDPVMAEIIADGKIKLYDLASAVEDAERLIIFALSGENVLFQSWEQFADYDFNAKLQQKRFKSLQMAIIVIGILGTALALFNQVYSPKDESGNIQIATGDRWWFIYYLLIALPIVLTILITAANRFKQGNKWLLLRAGAEAIKREIYRCRTRAGDYQQKAATTTTAAASLPTETNSSTADTVAATTTAAAGTPTTATPTTAASTSAPLPSPTPEQVLAQRVEDITRRVMRTEVNVSALKTYDKAKGFPPDMYAAQGGDDGLSVLSPSRYVEVRLGDQLNYYKKKSIKHEKELKVVQWAIFIVGGAGTLLAAINRQVWIALTTALASALTTYLSYQQTENTLMKYNQAWTDLSNVKAWWTALPPEEQAKPDNVTTLVDHTEQVLQSELDGWVQQMQNALAELRKGQEKAPETADGSSSPPDSKAGAVTETTNTDEAGSTPAGAEASPTGEEGAPADGGTVNPS